MIPRTSPCIGDGDWTATNTFVHGTVRGNLPPGLPGKPPPSYRLGIHSDTDSPPTEVGGYDYEARLRGLGLVAEGRLRTGNPRLQPLGVSDASSASADVVVVARDRVPSGRAGLRRDQLLPDIRVGPAPWPVDAALSFRNDL